MKLRYCLTILTVVLFIKTNAQNYQTIDPTKINYFADSYNDISVVRIDSISNTPFVQLFPFKTIESIGSNGCVSPFISSWIGRQINILPNGINQFVNRNNELININTMTKSQESWIAYASEDSAYVIATITSHQLETFLGITDSVKTISFQAYNKIQTPINSSINSYNIKLSKNYGLIETVNFHYFPDLEAYFPFNGLNHFKLFGQDLLNFEDINFTWFDVYDFNLGDELHIVASENDQYRAITENEIRTYLTRNNYSDSIVYEYASQKQVIIDTIFPNRSTSITYINDTLIEVIKQNLDFNKMPTEPIFHDNMVGFYGMNFDDDFVYKSYPDPNWEFWIDNPSDSCWNSSIFDGCIDFGNFIKGLGGRYFDCDVWTIEKSSRQLVYYKKDTITWGDPLDLTTIKESRFNSLEVIVFPNPAADKLQLQFGKTPNGLLIFELYNIVGEMISSTTISSIKQTVDISILTAGVYVYQLKQNNIPVQMDKIIIE